VSAQADQNNKDRWHLKMQQKLPSIFIGKLLPIAFFLIITVLYSRKLSYQDYGQFQTVWIFTNLVCTIIAFGLPTIIFATPVSWLKKYIDLQKKKIATLYIFCWLIAFGFLYYSAGNIGPSGKLILTGFIIMQFCATIADSILIKKNQLKSYLLINSIYSVLFFGIHLYFYFNHFVLNQLLVSIMILAMLKSLVLLALKGAPGMSDTIVPASRGFFTNWLYTGGNEVLGIIARWLDKIFLVYLLSPKEFAIFFNGSFEIPIFAIMISAMENVMLTNIADNPGDKTHSRNIFRESFKLLSLISFPIFFFLLFSHQEAYSIIFNNKYNESIPVFLISIFIIPLRISHYGVLLQSYGQAGKLALGSAMDICLSLLLMVVLYPWLGTRGIVLALVISTYLQVLYYLILSAKIMDTTLWQLIPLRYLTILFGALGSFYLLVSLSLKGNVSSLFFLLSMLGITTIIIAPSLYKYFSSRKIV